MSQATDSKPATIPVPWHSLSAIRAGLGTVPLFAPGSEAELADGIAYFLSRNVLLLPAGAGTNLIGSDDSTDSICVVSLKNMKLPPVHEDDIWTVPAGMALTRFIGDAAQMGWGGLAPLSGIPGTVGGALAMNAGANGRDIAASVQRVSGIDLTTGNDWSWMRTDSNDTDWNYRSSPVPRTVIALTARLRLSRVNPETEIEAIRQERLRRARVTPRGFSCGSVFRNPTDAPPAGVLLEQAACKGLSIGPFSVSLQHANWIVNLSGTPGPCADCIALVREMQARVKTMTGISILPEWRIYQ